MTNQPVLVWCEIPVTNLEKSCDFYAKTFGYKMEIDNSGPNPMAILNGEMSGTAGHLYPGRPADIGAGSTVHLALAPGDTVEAASKRAIAAGGSVAGPLVEMPFGRWSYATDLDGNSIGLFQAAG